MVSIKFDIKLFRAITILGIAFLLYFSTKYRPTTYPSLHYVTEDSPYVSPEGWPLPYPPSFK